MNTAKNPQQQPDTLPPSVCGFVALLWGGGGVGLYQYGQHFGTIVTLGSVFAAVMCTKWVIKTFDSFSFFGDQERREDLLKNAAAKRNPERFASGEEIFKVGLNAKKGIYYGSFEGKDLFHDTDQSSLVVAPAGCNKSTFVLAGTVINAALNLKSGKVKAKDTPSFVINDRTGELFCILRLILLKAGFRVEALCPWSEELSKSLGVKIEDACMNIFAQVDLGGDEETIQGEVERLVKLVAFEQDASNPKANFFLEEAQEVIVAVVLYMISRGEIPTLQDARHLLSGSPDELRSMYGDMAVSDAFDGELQRLGKKFLGSMGSAGQYQGLSATATQRLKIYKGKLGRHTSKAGFDPSTLKDEQPTVLFVIAPGEHTAVNAPWINTTFSVLIEAIARDTRHKTVDFLIDEAGNMGGAIPNLLTSMAAYRKQGFRATLFFQSIGQIIRLYGEHGFREMNELSAVLAAFGIVEHETCKRLSDMAGNDLYLDLSHAVKFGEEAPVNSSFRDKQLLTPQQIRTMPSDQLLIFAHNLKPIIAKKVPYFTRKKWARVAGKNPYYRG